jgi:hypothetical protein
MSAVTKHIHTTRNNSTIGPVYLPRPPGCMAAACRVSRMSVHVLHTLADVLFQSGPGTKSSELRDPMHARFSINSRSTD